MGQDIGEYDEFNEKRAVEWELLEQEDHGKLNRMVADLNKLYTTKPALYAKDTSWEGFEWINCITPNACMLSYIRKADKAEDMLVVVANFADAKQDFRVGVPLEGKYKEIFNTDDRKYGGSGCLNDKVCETLDMEWDGKPCAIDMVSAPLSISIFSYTPYTEEEKAQIEKKRAEEHRKAIEAEERRLAQEEAEQTAKAAAEAKELAKQAAAEAKEMARRAAAEAKEREKIAEALVKKAEEAALKLQKLTEKQEPVKEEGADQNSSKEPEETDTEKQPVKKRAGDKKGTAGKRTAAGRKTAVKKQGTDEK